MPQQSARQELLHDIQIASQLADQLQQADLEQQFEDESDTTGSSESFDDGLPGSILSPVSPVSPISPVLIFLFLMLDPEFQIPHQIPH